ncbi:variable surface protein [Plasmodium gonderi]|uniref:Variable surface protein n=1 Tax=Plasmodium gonderi TaxID=77519 RepID=A0A1Y1JS50_PLAGO|nr:variable surface protein [Plasmodium gonderi]GAW84017.1 variable surface protein [Plasmodium gonderi]
MLLYKYVKIPFIMAAVDVKFVDNNQEDVLIKCLEEFSKRKNEFEQIINKFDGNIYENLSSKCGEVYQYIKNIKDHLKNCIEKNNVLYNVYIYEIIKKIPKICVDILACGRNIKTNGESLPEIISEIEKSHEGSKECRQKLKETEELKSHSISFPEIHDSKDLKSIDSQELQNHVNGKVSEQQTIVSQEEQSENEHVNHLETQHEQHGLSDTHHYNVHGKIETFKESISLSDGSPSTKLDTTAHDLPSQRTSTIKSDPGNKLNTIDIDEHSKFNGTISVWAKIGESGLTSYDSASSKSEHIDSDGLAKIYPADEIYRDISKSHNDNSNTVTLDDVSGSKGLHYGHNDVQAAGVRGIPNLSVGKKDFLYQSDGGNGVHIETSINGVVHNEFHEMLKSVQHNLTSTGTSPYTYTVISNENSGIYNSDSSGKYTEGQNGTNRTNSTGNVITIGKDIALDKSIQVDQGISLKAYIIIALIPLVIILLLTFLIKHTSLGMFFKKKKRRKRKGMNEKLQRILLGPSNARERRVHLAYSYFEY